MLQCFFPSFKGTSYRKHQGKNNGNTKQGEVYIKIQTKPQTQESDQC